MTDLGSERTLERFHEVADAVAAQLAGVVDWGESGGRRGQYRADVGADDIAVSMLLEFGFAVLSEESGRTIPIMSCPAALGRWAGSCASPLKRRIAECPPGGAAISGLPMSMPMPSGWPMPGAV